MSRNKLERFHANSLAYNVMEPGKPRFDQMKGQWHAHFGNQNPIVLELACGRGEYSLALAAKHPHLNIVGVDIKGARIWKGSQAAIQQGLANVAFLRTKIQNIEDFFAPGEVAEIWLIHPDPRPKEVDIRRRLTNPRFLNHYRRLGGPGVQVRLKTDSAGLFAYTMEVLAGQAISDLQYTEDLYQSPLLADHLDVHGQPIRTKYEEMFMAKGCRIHYVKFRLQTPPGLIGAEAAD
ncbi:MAG: tRNA (guanosine(46)-N7)-methyltransferase TrmB [Bernardetiaceae bacterium]|nr:tRNA (guanosine(46)-N7)-methyltransferase TrmB [Bernardetiaceae bacterium]